MSDHFQGKDALRHIAEVQARGVIASSEIHGAETPGSYFAAFDASREIALLLSISAVLLHFFSLSSGTITLFLLSFSVGALIWKVGRSSWLAWARLERLHRVAFQEQKEIQENRGQEREELRALYRAKGFQGKLLDDVIDVLMADSDRLLRVMLQEEMGFRLEENEHPLIQGLGAGIGTLVSSALCIVGFISYGILGLLGAAIIVLILSAGGSAYREQNYTISAIIWNIAIGAFALVTAYYMLEYFSIIS